MRHNFLMFSRALAIILLGVYVVPTCISRCPPYIVLSYVCSRIFLHNPPGEGNALRMEETLPEGAKEKLAECVFLLFTHCARYADWQ